MVIRGLPAGYSGKEVAMNTLEGVKKYAYSDIHVHIEPVDGSGRQFATAYIKFTSSHEAEKAIEIIANTQGPHLKSEICSTEELYNIRESGNRIRPPRGPPGMRNSGSDAKPLFELDVGLVRLKLKT